MSDFDIATKIYQEQDITKLKPFPIKKEVLLKLNTSVSEARLES